MSFDIILPNDELNALFFYFAQKVNKKNANMSTLLTDQKITEFEGIITNSKTKLQNTWQKVSKNVKSDILKSSATKSNTGQKVKYIRDGKKPISRNNQNTQ